jgi:hypothetical protein
MVGVDSADLPHPASVSASRATSPSQRVNRRKMDRLEACWMAVVIVQIYQTGQSEIANRILRNRADFISQNSRSRVILAEPENAGAGRIGGRFGRLASGPNDGRGDRETRRTMRIGIGRRQLVVRIEQTCVRPAGDAYPMAVNASDAELARLGTAHVGNVDRARWETTAAMYGAVRLRTA